MLKLLIEGKYLHLFISKDISQPWIVFGIPNFQKYNGPGVKYKNCISIGVKVNLLHKAVK